MKKIVFFIATFFALKFTNAQSAKVDFSQPPPNIDSLLVKIAAEKNDSARYYLALSALTISETNPVEDMHNSEKILLYGQKNNDLVCQLLGHACLSYDYLAFGNPVKCFEHGVLASQVAEKSKDVRLITFGKAVYALSYMLMGDLNKAIEQNMLSINASTKYETDIITVCSYNDMGMLYLYKNKVDSALMYTQKAYELGIKANITYWNGLIYLQFGSIHAAMKNPTLALSYWNMALAEASRIKSPKLASNAYTAMATFYKSSNQSDSSIFYANKAIAAVRNTAFYTLNVEPAKILLDLYSKKNIDSAFKYSEIFRIAKDSLFNTKNTQQAQLLAFEENTRQEELKLAEQENQQKIEENLQYTFIAVGIVTFFIIFLIFSRRLITNTKLIEFLSVIALLIVFEFLNLLIHPILEKVTHHSPFLMLLALVSLAALLIPLHHKIEKWAVNQLVEKNKAARLKAAKRTIEELEKA